MTAVKHCGPCSGQTPKLSEAEIAESMVTLPNWEVKDGYVQRAWRGKDFAEVIAKINQIADLAENEGHHPDLHLTNYRHLLIQLRTHEIKGLSQNDFIMAHLIDEIL